MFREAWKDKRMASRQIYHANLQLLYKQIKSMEKMTKHQVLPRVYSWKVTRHTFQCIPPSSAQAIEASCSDERKHRRSRERDF